MKPGKPLTEEEKDVLWEWVMRGVSVDGGDAEGKVVSNESNAVGEVEKK
jgi:hypothetical protein